MARNVLYVTNLAPETDAEVLGELFSEYGEVKSIEFGNHRISKHRFALVEMAIEKVATKANHGLNGRKIGEYYLAVSYPEPDYSRPLLGKQQKVADKIAAELNETEKKPIRMIYAIVLLCGTSFAQAILEEAKTIDAGDGIMTSDGSQRRTLGGIFFFLCRYRMSDEMRKIVFNRKGKLPQPEEETEAGAEEPVETTE